MALQYEMKCLECNICDAHFDVREISECLLMSNSFATKSVVQSCFKEYLLY